MRRRGMRTKIVGVMFDKVLKWLTKLEMTVYIFAINITLLLLMYIVYIII
jgi:cell division protein FtsL